MTNEEKEAIINAAKSCDELCIRFIEPDDGMNGFSTIRPAWYRKNSDEACRHLAELYRECDHVHMHGWSRTAEVIIYGPHSNDESFNEWSKFEDELRLNFDVKEW